GGAQRDGAVRLCIPQRFGKQLLARGLVFDQLAEIERVDAALGQIEVDLVLKRGLHPLQRERFEFHTAHSTPLLHEKDAWFLNYTDVPVRSSDKDGNFDVAAGRTATAVAPNLARIPAGDFLMGAADAEEDERPVHRVFVGEFFIARFPVTQEEYARFVR